jgi:hypothetical protein
MILKFSKFSLKINLNSSETAKKLNSLKNIRSKINTWGDEVYFETPYLAIKLDEKARDLITFGEITYWCEGNSIAIGFGPTPASRNNKEIRLVTKTNVFGSFSSSVSILDALRYLKNNEIVLIN